MSCIKIPAVQNDSSSVSVEMNDINNKYNELIFLAKKVFKNNWSHSETSSTIDFTDYCGGKHYVGCHTTVKVQLPNGIYHEASGYSSNEASIKGLAIEKARKTSVTNALNNVFSCFPEMDAEMQPLKLTSCQNPVLNISNITKTKFARKVQCMPPAQSTPRRPKSPAMIENIQANKISAAFGDEIETIEINEQMQTDADLDAIFDSPVRLQAPMLNMPAFTPAISSASLTEEEQRLERKRKQKEKQEEFKRQMKDKEKEKQKLAPEIQKPNPKF